MKQKTQVYLGLTVVFRKSQPHTHFLFRSYPLGLFSYFSLLDLKGNATAGSRLHATWLLWFWTFQNLLPWIHKRCHWQRLSAKAGLPLQANRSLLKRFSSFGRQSFWSSHNPASQKSSPDLTQVTSRARRKSRMWKAIWPYLLAPTSNRWRRGSDFVWFSYDYDITFLIPNNPEELMYCYISLFGS